MEMTVNDRTIQVVNFSTHEFHGSIDIRYVTKVIALPRLDPAPSSPEYMVGLLNIAGTIIPVIDLSMRLNMSRPKHYDLNTPILICKNNDNKQFGLIVESVYEIEDVSNEMIQVSNLDGVDHKFVEGAIKHKDAISILLNIDAISRESDDHS